MICYAPWQKPEKPCVNPSTSSQAHRRRSKRVRGFFAFAETLPDEPRGILQGQQTPDSCIPACCRMMLFDHFPDRQGDYDFSESYLRAQFGTDEEGTDIRMIPDVLRAYGLPRVFEYQTNLTMEALRQAVQQGTAIAIVRKSRFDDAHALLLEAITTDKVFIRDPLPQGIGSAYAIALETFLAVWQSPQTRTGKAVIVG